MPADAWANSLNPNPLVLVIVLKSRLSKPIAHYRLPVLPNYSDRIMVLRACASHRISNRARGLWTDCNSTKGRVETALSPAVDDRRDSCATRPFRTVPYGVPTELQVGALVMSLPSKLTACRWLSERRNTSLLNKVSTGNVIDRECLHCRRSISLTVAHSKQKFLYSFYTEIQVNFAVFDNASKMNINGLTNWSCKKFYLGIW